MLRRLFLLRFSTPNFCDSGSHDTVSDTLVLLHSLLKAVAYSPSSSPATFCTKARSLERGSAMVEISICLDLFTGNISGCGAVDLVPLAAFFVSLITVEVYVFCQCFKIFNGNGWKYKGNNKHKWDNKLHSWFLLVIFAVSFNFNCCIVLLNHQGSS